MRKLVIGISGLKGSGKSTLASMLIENGFSEYSFAQPMKEALSVITGLDYDWFDNQKTKELPMENFASVSARHMMQTLGTEWGRECIHKDFWLMVSKQRIDALNSHVVISDIRFENEADFVRSMGGSIIHVVRKGLQNNDSHVSEKGIAFDVNDFVIYNDQDLDYLRSEAKKIIDYFL